MAESSHSSRLLNLQYFASDSSISMTEYDYKVYCDRYSWTVVTVIVILISHGY